MSIINQSNRTLHVLMNHSWTVYTNTHPSFVIRKLNIESIEFRIASFRNVIKFLTNINRSTKQNRLPNISFAFIRTILIWIFSFYSVSLNGFSEIATRAIFDDCDWHNLFHCNCDIGFKPMNVIDSCTTHRYIQPTFSRNVCRLFIWHINLTKQLFFLFWFFVFFFSTF